MARIRSIKPIFWTDGKIKRLAPAHALFFIGLWNFCDDEGKIRADLDTLAMSLPIFAKREIIWAISALIREGLIKVYSDHPDFISGLSFTHRGIISGLSQVHHWFIVTSWTHQRISKPIDPKTLLSDLIEVPLCVPQPDQERSTQGKDRIGKDRIGKDGGDSRKKKDRTPAAPVPEGVQSVIGIYCERFKERYQGTAVIRGKESGLIKGFVKDFGKEKAIQFIDAYFDMPDTWFVTKRHDIPTMLANLNAISQFIETGRMVTRREIQQLDKRVANANLLEAIERGEV